MLSLPDFPSLNNVTGATSFPFQEQEGQEEEEEEEPCSPPVATPGPPILQGWLLKRTERRRPFQWNRRYFGASECLPSHSFRFPRAAFPLTASHPSHLSHLLSL